MPEKTVVAIDGPSGAGKSTVSRRVARRLGFAFLDTGAVYRAVGLAAREEGVDPGDRQAVERWVGGVEVELAPAGEGFLVTYRGRDVEPFIRNEEMGRWASRVSAQPAVREKLLDLQRSAAFLADLVAEGRDMGTVVFPGAALKIFLTALPRERARRRWKELLPSRPELRLEEVEADMAERDRRDSSREAAPLRPAPGAVVVDTTDLDLNCVVELVLERFREAMGTSGLS